MTPAQNHPAAGRSKERQAAALVGQPDGVRRAANDLAAATPEVFAQYTVSEALNSYPGIGPLTGARVLGEIADDRSRFREARALKVYAGTAPTTVASGKSHAVHH